MASSDPPTADAPSTLVEPEQKPRFNDHLRRLVDFKAHGRDLARLPTNLRSDLCDTWLDHLTIGLITALSLSFWFWIPHTFLQTRYFPINFASGMIVYPDLAYPDLPIQFNNITAAVVPTAIPIAVLLLSQIWIRNFHDASNALLGLTYAQLSATCCQVILKKTVGGFRPHFLTVCQPVIPPGTVGLGFQQTMFTIAVCTGDRSKILNAVESFPSGHAAIAFSGLLYLSIYLFTHLRILGERRPSHWKMVLVIVPVLLATYIACSVVFGYHHHAHDVIFGGLLGSLMAVFGYRMCFCSILDPSTNWKPLGRSGRAAASEKTNEEAAERGESSPFPV